jgi:CheY-like chemotaxis protein
LEKILIINDEQTKTENLGYALASLPYEVHIANSTAEGVQMFRSLLPFLIVLDFVPSSNQGLEFVSILSADDTLKTMHPCHFSSPSVSNDILGSSIRGANFYIIVLYENMSRHDIQLFRDLGVDYLLSKPVHLFTLQRIINNIHRLKTTRDELCQKFSIDSVNSIIK